MEWHRTGGGVGWGGGICRRIRPTRYADMQACNPTLSMYGLVCEPSEHVQAGV